MTDIKTVQALKADALEIFAGCSQETRDAIEWYDASVAALIAQMQRDAVQPGWKLVPVEPTREMLTAWLNEPARTPAHELDELGELRDASFCYRAMIAVAPHPEAQALDSQLQQPDGHSTRASGVCPTTTPAPEGWRWILVDGSFDALVVALNRAESKGYMPDAMAEEWEALNWQEAHEVEQMNAPSRRSAAGAQQQALPDAAQRAAQDHAYAEGRKDECEAWEARRLAQQQDDVGGLEYRGNSVSFIHSKMTAYRSAIDEAWTALRECGRLPDGKTRLADAIRALAQQDDHAGSPAPSDNLIGVDRGALQMALNVLRRAGKTEVADALSESAQVAESSKAALSDEDARLSEDDLHARSWWCPTCKKDVPPEMVTKDGEHYLEAGGCGYAVRGELIEDQPKQPLSDDEIHRIWMETPERPTLAEEVLAFGRTLLARAGITRKPMPLKDRRPASSSYEQGWQEGYDVGVREAERFHGITPQAGKESGE